MSLDEKLFGRGLVTSLAPPTDSALRKEFLYPPFSVLNARDGDWQARKRAWLRLGIEGEFYGNAEGRDAPPGGSPRPLARKRAEQALGRDDGLTYGTPDDPHHYRHKEKDAGRGKNLLGHSTTSGNPQFYDQKRRVEKEDGREYTTKEAKARLIELGRIAAFSAEDMQPKGRGGNPLKFSDAVNSHSGLSGTSIFDPVLCELMYCWFCPPGGQAVDPFAGGSVRGIVAAMTGRKYWGADLRPEQIAANERQADAICPDNRPCWVCGDARAVLSTAPAADFTLTCPPYGHLEQYSDDPRDLSNMPLADFRAAYQEIMQATADRLKDDRFAVWVVGDYRDKEGMYCNLPGGTIAAARRAGLRLYNEAILVTAAASLALRVRKQFVASRKFGKTHQNILIFVKGDPRRAAAACQGDQC